MKIITVTDNEKYKGHSLHKNLQIGITGVKPGSNVPGGNYSVFLSGKRENGNLFQEIVYRIPFDVSTAEKTWIYQHPIKWININLPTDEKLIAYTFILSKTSTPLAEGIVVNWKWQYKVAIKDVDEDGYVRFDQTEVNKLNCMTYSYTESDKFKGQYKSFDAKCPIDPETKKEMYLCLNWRRTDDMGNLCNKYLLTEDKEKTKKEFCNTFPNAQDCKCINRKVYLEYNRDKPKNTDHDYCWYGPCKSGVYLLDEEVKCSEPIKKDTNKNDSNRFPILFYAAIIAIILFTIFKGKNYHIFV